jgi:hypothetical protein
MVTSEQMKEWWNLNKDSEIVKQRNKKISENHRGWKHTDEAKEKMRLNQLGRVMSKEARKKMSIARKGHRFSKEHNKKISIANKGKILSKETKNKISNIKKSMWRNITAQDYWGHDRSGENNPNFINGRSMVPYVGFTRKFKKQIKERDNYVCMNCGIHSEKVRLEIHHIDGNKTLSIPQNCITLCHQCHSLTLGDSEYWKQVYQDRLSKLYKYRYENGNIILTTTKEVNKNGFA